MRARAPEWINRERAAFEDAAFNQRFLSGLTRNPDRNAQFPAFTVDCPTQAEFVAKNPDGSYVEDTLNAAWWAWQKRAGDSDEVAKRIGAILDGMDVVEQDALVITASAYNAMRDLLAKYPKVAS